MPRTHDDGAPGATPLERIQELGRSAPGFATRTAKHAAQARHGWLHPRQVTFVFGCQRSGTKMVMRVLDQSEETRIYHENHGSAFRDFQLRSDAVVRALVATSPARAHVFKPICDSHRADVLLERHPGAHALWVFRHPDDVANSAAKKWGAHQREVVQDLVAGRGERWGWRTERVPAEVVEALRSVARLEPPLSDLEGALLWWYLRNSFLFTLGLDRHPRMLVVGYEALVQDPESGFQRLFAQVGVPFRPDLVAGVRQSSVRRRDPPSARPAIRQLCDDLLTRLLAAAEPPPPVPLPSPVLILMNTLEVGGAERYTVTVSRWLAQRGVDVTVASAGGPLVDQLDPLVRHETVDLTAVRGSLPLVGSQVRALLRRTEARAIVANSVATAWVGRVAGAGLGVPVVSVAHGWSAERYGHVAPLLRAAHRVVAVSPEVKDRLVASGLPPRKVEVVFNGVDTARFGPRDPATRAACRAALGARPEELLVISVGRLAAQKAHHHLLDLALRLRATHPTLRYAVVGEGELEAELAAQAVLLGVDGLVTFTGVRSDVPDLLASADLFLSCSDWEGMPLATIEAMAAGLPVVATRTEGASWLITPECGRLVGVGDLAGLADAVAELAADPALRGRLGRAAAERARSRFDHGRMAGGLAEVVARVLRDEPARS